MSEQKNNNTLFIILGAVGFFALCFFACCGFGVYKGYQGVQEVVKVAEKMSKLVSIDPVEIDEATNEITDINIPIIFSPQILNKAQMVQPKEDDIKGIEDIEKLAEGPFCVTVQYQGAGDQITTLELAGFIDPPYTKTDRKPQTDYLEKLLKYHYAKQPERVPLPDVPNPEYNGHAIEKLEREVRGEKVTFNLHSEAGTAATTPKYWILEGTFPGKHGPAKILLRVEAKQMTHDEIVQMADSIK